MIKPSFRYKLLKQYVRLGLLIFFKKWQNANVQHVPTDGPFIFVANHQNAFLDAILVVCGTSRNPWFLARGDVFKKDFIIKLLTFMRIKPVFRFRDGHGAMRKNDKIMDECVQLLKEGECILLFAEGNHNEPWTTRNLQRGFAHMALQYIEKTGQDIPLVPVGFHYEQHQNFRSRVLVNYGQPVSTKKVIGSLTDQREQLNVLADALAEKLKELILVIPLDESYESKKKFLIENRSREKDMVTQLHADRQAMENWKPSEPASKRINLFYNWFNPLFLYGRVVHFIPHTFINWVLSQLKDDQFIGSVKISVGIFAIPIYYLIVILIFHLLSPELLWTLAFSASLPISGLFAYNKF